MHNAQKNKQVNNFEAKYDCPNTAHTLQVEDNEQQSIL